ncbi:hypothetical protein ACFE04_005081 [Oxalis oulophora]
MVSVKTIAFVSILVLLQPLTALSGIGSSLTPGLLDPVLGNMCKKVNCGMGTCKPSPKSSFFFECECDDDWLQSSSDYKFLPCVVPDCSINYGCEGMSPAPAPLEDKVIELKKVFDPCQWIDCGGGSCNKTSKLSYDCVCESGYHNLMNLTSLPCYKECALGAGCGNLGISLHNSSQTPPPTTVDNGEHVKSAGFRHETLYLSTSLRAGGGSLATFAILWFGSNNRSETAP